MAAANRAFGYLVAAALSSFFYVVWLTVELEVSTRTGVPSEGLFFLGFAAVFWIFGGTSAALALILLPWSLVVIGYKRLRLTGPTYFVLIGAILMLSVGCATASLAPKPFFIEDQTFLEGFVIAAERQGVCLLLMGAVLGFTYWFVSERRRDAS